MRNRVYLRVEKYLSGDLGMILPLCLPTSVGSFGHPRSVPREAWPQPVADLSVVRVTVGRTSLPAEPVLLITVPEIIKESEVVY